VLAQLRVPSHADRHSARMVGQPAIVVATALAQSVAFFSETNQRNKQNVGLHRFGVAFGLQHSERADFEIAVAEGIAVRREFHSCFARCEPWKYYLVAALMEEFGVASGRRFEGIGVVKADHRIRSNLGQQGGRRAVE